MEHWHWPQIIVAILFALQVVTHVSKHGETRKYDGPISFVDIGMYSFILYMGGFWS